MQEKVLQKGIKENTSRLFPPEALRKLILPLIWEQALALTVGMADTMMIASAGEAAVSGVSLVDMVNVLIISVLSALATGGAVVTSQFIGAGKREDANRSAKQLLYVTTLITVIVSILVAVFSRPLLRLLFGAVEQDVFRNAWIYLLVSTVSFPFMAIYNAAAALFRSMGNSGITFKVSVLVNLINVAGNAVCVMGLGMGVLGVAIPTLVSRAVGALVLYVLLRNPDNLICIDKSKFRWDGMQIRRILSIGIPNGIENGIFQFGRVLVVSIISGFGTAQIAANGVANSLDSIGCVIGFAMSLAMITVVGQCVGAGSPAQVKYYTKKMLRLTYLYSALLNIPLLLALPWILKLYSLGPEATELSYILVLIHNGVAIFLWPLAFVLPNMLRACNDARFTMIVSVATMVIFRIGFSYIFGVYMGLGAIGVWYAMVLDWIFRSLFFVVRYIRGKWKETANLHHVDEE